MNHVDETRSLFWMLPCIFQVFHIHHPPAVQRSKIIRLHIRHEPLFGSKIDMPIPCSSFPTRILLGSRHDYQHVHICPLEILAAEGCDTYGSMDQAQD